MSDQCTIISYRELNELNERIASLSAELADRHKEKEYLDECLRNEADRADKAEMELSALKEQRKWQSGRPPKDGWYWVRRPTVTGERVLYLHCDYWHEDSTDQWQGPLEPSEDV